MGKKNILSINIRQKINVFDQYKIGIRMEIFFIAIDQVDTIGQ